MSQPLVCNVEWTYKAWRSSVLINSPNLKHSVGAAFRCADCATRGVLHLCSQYHQQCLSRDATFLSSAMEMIVSCRSFRRCSSSMVGRLPLLPAVECRICITDVNTSASSTSEINAEKRQQRVQCEAKGPGAYCCTLAAFHRQTAAEGGMLRHALTSQAARQIIPCRDMLIRRSSHASSLSIRQ